VAYVSQYAVMNDECTDINGVEKLSICICYLADSKVRELFLGGWPVVSTKADDLYQSAVTNLATFGLSPDRLVTASFDADSYCTQVHVATVR